MKRYILPILLASVLTACPSPVLQWIDTPVDYSGLGRLAGPGGASIVSLSFGIEGEKDLPIGTEADISGKIPILVILPEGTGLTELIPLVRYIGKSVNPPSGLTGDFTSPVTYTVTAEDNSTKDYIVRVYEKGDSTKEIIRLTLDVSRNGGSPLGAEGIINQETGDITVNVPAGSPTYLTAHITHTGDRITDPLGKDHFEKTETETFTFSSDFSSPTTWTVFARDGSTKTYTLHVVREKDSTKEITSFSLHISGETDIIGGEPRSDGVYPILALVPESSTLTGKQPSVNYRGVAISPEDDKPLDFTTPVRYTVSAEDGTTRDYEVQIILRHQDSECLITGFYFQNFPERGGVIDQVAHTIALTVPPGTNLNGLIPEVYYRGAFVSPESGQPKSFVWATDPITTSPSVPYTVYAANGDRQTYKVYVFPDDSIPPKVDVPSGEKVDVGVGVNTDDESLIFVEFPTYIYSPTINIGYPIDKTQVINTGDTYNYYDYSSTVKMIVIMPPADPPAPPASTDPLYGVAKIDAFYFTNPAAIGEINQSAGTINVKVPYGTELGDLTATICYTGKEIAGHPGANPIKDKRSFNSSVAYTVNPYSDDILLSKTYTVTVTPQPNTAKEITAFSLGVTSESVIISAYPNATGEYYPIDVTVPTGTTISSLTPTITHNGKYIAGENLSQSSNPTVTPSAINFTWSGSPLEPPTVEYEVTAEDGTAKKYVVTVHHDDSGIDEPEILGFYFNNPLAVGVVNQNTNAITVTVPSGTNTRALSPALYFKGVSVRPGSGAVNSFATPATYTVTGSTGKTRSYLVTVNPAPSSTKDITSFAFPSVPGAETVIGAVPDSDGTYPLAVWVPSGTALGGLAPAISHTGVSVNPPSGTIRDFNVPQIYTVTAEDGSAKTYKVTVTPQNTDAKILTSFVFNEVPFGSSPVSYVRAVGSIDQDGKTVTVTVPNTADITNLIPTLTYIGKSVTEPGGSAQTANPFTGAGKSYDAGQTQNYIVNGQNSPGQGYTVHVIKQIAETVDFTGETDIVFASSTFNQQTGVITVTVDTGQGVTAPYEWYVNGVKQVAIGEQFTLSVNGFTPGKHEIMVSGRKNGLHYTGKVYFTVSK